MIPWPALAAGGWATLVCAATFAWLAQPTAPDAGTPQRGASALSEPVAIAMSGANGTHYLSFRIRYVAGETARSLPIEAAASDVLIEAAASGALSHGRGWREGVRDVLAEAGERLGAHDIRLEETRRVKAGR